MPRHVWNVIAFLAPVAHSTASVPGESDRGLAAYRFHKGWDLQIAAAERLVVNHVTMIVFGDGRIHPTLDHDVVRGRHLEDAEGRHEKR
jgi:hypothetical protein